MIFLIYFYLFFLIVPLYVWFVNTNNYLPFFDLNIDSRWRARLLLSTPVVWLFSPAILGILMMVMFVLFIGNLGEMWKEAFPIKEVEDEE